MERKDVRHSEIHFPEGIKWTRQRKAVYEVLWEEKEPLTPVKLYNLVEQRTADGEYALSTIYRILSAFEEKGLVEKDSSMEDGTLLYSLRRGNHTHYAVCLECHKRIALAKCPFAHLSLEQETEDFTITNHKLELYGYCKDCRESGRLRRL